MAQWLWLMLALVASTAAAAAQSQTYTITLTVERLNQIGKILGKQPYEDVGELINDISRQVQAQNQKAQAEQRAKIIEDAKEPPK